jgi:CubicO group peptidase (beta-lactamase class C family)
MRLWLALLALSACRQADRGARALASLPSVVAVDGKPSPLRSLEDRMRYFHVPGASIAVADGGRIVWARGLGVRTVGGAAVEPSTPFNAASVSKLAAALTTLRLVADGKLALDENVNTYLRSWKVPENSFTATQKVTLRRILSHSAGLTGHTVDDFPDGAPLPSLPDVLDGKTKTEAVRVDVVPGTISRYSGGGVTIEQLLLTDVTGEPFAQLTAERVLQPLGMADSSFAQPLDPATRARAAVAHDAAGKPLPYVLYAASAAAGLWTTPRDLLALEIALAEARAGRSTILPRALASDMLTAQKPPFGLGPFLEGSGRAFHFGHEGWNDGFHTEVVYFPETGQGACVMVNGDGGRPLLREILYALAAEYKWPALEPEKRTTVAVDDATRAHAVGKFESIQPAGVIANLSLESGRLYLDAPRLGVKTEMVFIAPMRIASLDTGDELALVGDASAISALKFGFVTLTRR